MRSLWLLLVVPVMSLAACGETTIDTPKAETVLTEQISEQVGVPVKSVACPETVEVEKGASFECTVTAEDGTTGDATATQTDAKGSVSFSAPFVHVVNIEKQVASELGDGATVDCPDIVVGAKGDTFECEASSGTQKATIQVTQKDDQGNVRYEVVGA